MAKCLVCGMEYTEWECPVCRYKEVYILNPSKEDIEVQKQEVVEWRRNILKKAGLRIQVYSYKNKISAGGEDIVMEEPDQASIFLSAADLAPGESIWYQEEFLNLRRNMELSCEIIKIDGSIVRKKEELKNPGVDMETIRVGILMEDGFVLRMILGNEKQYTKSQAYPLVNRETV